MIPANPRLPGVLDTKWRGVSSLVDGGYVTCSGEFVEWSAERAGAREWPELLGWRTTVTLLSQGVASSLQGASVPFLRRFLRPAAGLLLRREENQ